MVSAYDLETSVSSSTPASAIIYDAYTSIIQEKKGFHRLKVLLIENASDKKNIA